MLRTSTLARRFARSRALFELFPLSHTSSSRVDGDVTPEKQHARMRAVVPTIAKDEAGTATKSLEVAGA